MNTLVFFVAGVTIGLIADKFYHSLLESKNQIKEVDKEETVETIEEKVTELDKQTGNKKVVKTEEKVDRSQTAEVSEQETNKVDNDSSRTKKRNDDLSQLKGAGPKLVAALDKIGIYNFEQLSSSSADTLLDQLRQTGGRFSKPVISSIVKQAQDQIKANEK